MCSMWTDGFAGVAHHIRDAVSFVVVARAPLETLRGWGRRRGWDRLRLLSSSGSDFNADFGTELTPDRQLPAMSVFTRTPDDTLQHFSTSEGSLVESHHRAMDLLTPIWNLLDLLPEGRGVWMPKPSYGGA